MNDNVMNRQRPLTEEMTKFGRQTTHYLLAILKETMDELRQLRETSKPPIDRVSIYQ